MTELIAKPINRLRAPFWLLGILIIFYLPVLIDLVKDWYSDPNYSHGFLILPIAAFLFWLHRDELIAIDRPSYLGAVILGFGLTLLILGSAAAEYFTVQVSFIICIAGISLFFLGWWNFKQNWFVFFFLLFMIPIPGIIYYSATMPMQLFASKAANLFLQLVGIASVRSGNIIILLNYRLEVAEACSGLRSLVSLMALGALYARFALPGVWRPIILFMATIPIAICANIFRIFITGVCAFAISPKLADDFLHEISGVLVFSIALFLTVVVGKVLRWTAKSQL
jgi:exosortase